MSNASRDTGAASKQGSGKRRQPWTERTARRAKRVAGSDSIVRILPDGTIELVPVTGAEHGGHQNEWDGVK